MPTAMQPRQVLKTRIAKLQVALPVQDVDELVEATAQELELMLAELVPAEFHAVTLADADVLKWWPWSEQTQSGEMLYFWGGVGGSSSVWIWPDGVTPEEVAAWMLPALKRHNHRMADDGPADISAAQWEAWATERQRSVIEIREKMTPGLPLNEWAALNAEMEKVERQHGERLGTWADRAEGSLMVAARGFTYPHNGTRGAPRLPAPIITHPVTGKEWPWRPEAMVTLYLANPVTVAARCVRALERMDTRKTEEAHLATARNALEELNVDAENMGRLAGDLADELRKRIAEARTLLDVDAALESIRKTSGHAMLPWDEKAAAFFEGLSAAHAQGTAVADALREVASIRWAEGKDLFRLWTPQQPHGVPLFALHLAMVLWQDVVGPRVTKLRERSRLVPVATVHPIVARTTLWGATATKVQRVNGALSISGEEWRGSLPPSAAVTVAKNALGADPASGGRIVGALVAWLARRVWERWQAGEERFDYVPMPAGRNEMRQSVLGYEVEEDELDRALAWLMAERIGGLSVVVGVHEEERSGERGGRPRKVRVVHVGAALAPMGLESVFKDADAILPPELRFYGFVLEPMHAPLIGDRRTHARQRDAFALFLGLHLTNRRTEYAESGGVAINPAKWRAALKGLGIYHRSHASLADDVLAAYLKKPDGELFPHGPVLEETEPGSQIYRLGPDYRAQHDAILTAADVSEAASKRARMENKKNKQKLRANTRR